MPLKFIFLFYDCKHISKSSVTWCSYLSKKGKSPVWQEPGVGVCLFLFLFLLISFILFFIMLLSALYFDTHKLRFRILLISMMGLIFSLFIVTNINNQLRSGMRHPTNLLSKMYCLRVIVYRPSGNTCYLTIDASCLTNLSLALRGLADM